VTTETVCGQGITIPASLRDTEICEDKHECDDNAYDDEDPSPS
jgi:hypothetical protein